MQVHDLGVVECDWSSLVDASGLGSFDTSALTLPDEADFHLGHHPKDCQDHLANRSLCRDFGFQNSEVRSLAFKLMDEIEDVACAAAKAVEFDHDQRVTRTDEVQNGGQFRPTIACPTGRSEEHTSELQSLRHLV